MQQPVGTVASIGGSAYKGRTHLYKDCGCAAVLLGLCLSHELDICLSQRKWALWTEAQLLAKAACIHLRTTSKQSECLMPVRQQLQAQVQVWH